MKQALDRILLFIQTCISKQSQKVTQLVQRLALLDSRLPPWNKISTLIPKV